MTTYQDIQATHIAPAMERRSTWTRAVAIGAGVGLAWGISMRIWMRFITTNPEFTIAGTMFILVASVIAGSVLGLARHRRNVGGQGWWRLSLLALLLLGAAGAVMWPTVILWGIAVGRRRPGWLVAPLLVAGSLAQIPVVNDAIFDNWRLSAAAASIALLWYLPMLALEAWGFSIAFARSTPGVRMAVWKRVVIAVPIVAIAGLSALVVGMPM